MRGKKKRGRRRSIWRRNEAEIKRRRKLKLETENLVSTAISLILSRCRHFNYCCRRDETLQRRGWFFFCFLNHRVSLKPDELNWTTVSNRRAVEIKKEEERRTRGLSVNHTHHRAERGRREQGRRELGGGGGGGATYWTGWIMLSVLA